MSAAVLASILLLSPATLTPSEAAGRADDEIDGSIQARSAQAPGTVVNVTDRVLQNQVPRLGINIGGVDQWGVATMALKNIVPNPGFEGGVYRSNILLRAQGSNTTMMMQDLWDRAWNNDTWGIGQPAGFWDGAEYEFVHGAAKGTSGNVSRFDYAPDGQGTTRPVFHLDRAVAAPGQLDVMTVRKELDLNYVMSVNGSAFPWSRGGDRDVRFDRAENRPGSPGVQSLRLGTSTTNTLYMDSTYRDGDVSYGKGVIVRGDWRLGFWAKGNATGDQLAVRFFRETLPQPFVERMVALNTTWSYYEFDFSVQPGVDEDRDYKSTEYRPILGLRVSTEGISNPGNVWIDEVSLGRRGHANPTVLSDVYLGLLGEYSPGIVRGWYGQLGDSLDEFTDPTMGRGGGGWRIGGRSPQWDSYSAGEFLQIAEALNASAWLVFPPVMRKQEYTQLIDYIAGPTSTAYGAKRAAQGHPLPYTQTLSTIFLEFGNELWGAGTANDPFGGASVAGGVRLGAIANDAFAAMRANPNFDGSRIQLTIGGQAGYPGRQDEIEKNSQTHDSTALAPYFYGSIPDYSNIEDIFGPLYAHALHSSAAGGMKESVGYIRNSGKGSEPSIYELNFHTTGTTGADEAERNDIVTSQGGGIALPLAMLTYMELLGVKNQTAFSAIGYSYRYDSNPSKYVRLWGMLRDVERTENKRPTWLGSEVVNRGIQGDLVETTHSGDDPKWTQQPKNGLPAATEVPYIQSFAFRDGNSSSIVLFNLHRTDVLNVSLDLPREPSPTASLDYLSSSSAPAGIYEDNERQRNVTLGSGRISGFADGYQFPLPPHSIVVIGWSSLDPSAPPTVVSTHPSDQETVPASTNITIWFSRGMDRVATEAAVVLSPTASWSSSWNAESTVLDLDPIASLSSSSLYNLSVSKGAKAIDGTPLATVHSSSFWTQIPVDTEPPTILHVPPGPVIEKTAVPIFANVSDGSGIFLVQLFYRVEATSIFKRLTMERGKGDAYLATIPAAEVVPSRVEYYIDAQDKATNKAWSPPGAPAALHSFEVRAKPLPGLPTNEVDPDPSRTWLPLIVVAVLIVVSLLIMIVRRRRRRDTPHSRVPGKQ